MVVLEPVRNDTLPGQFYEVLVLRGKVSVGLRTHRPEVRDQRLSYLSDSLTHQLQDIGNNPHLVAGHGRDGEFLADVSVRMSSQEATQNRADSGFSG